MTGTDCPEHYGTYKDGLLRTTVFADDLEKNKGNVEVLPPLLKAYKRYSPQLYAHLVVLFSASQKAAQSHQDDVRTENVPVNNENQIMIVRRVEEEPAHSEPPFCLDKPSGPLPDAFSVLENWK